MNVYVDLDIAEVCEWNQGLGYWTQQCQMETALFSAKNFEKNLLCFVLYSQFLSKENGLNFSILFLDHAVKIY